MNPHLQSVHAFQLKKIMCMLKKKNFSKDVWITPTFIKGTHSIDAEMNAESFEYCHFP